MTNAPTGSASRSNLPAGRARIGLFGGTFDPPHIGHLVLARSAALALDLDLVLLIPSGEPWQKVGLATSAHDRLQMLHAAVRDLPPRPDERWHLEVDDRETRRHGPTFTIDTLEELRAEFGPQTQLVWLMGADQFANLPTWHRWQELLDVAHLAVTARGPQGMGQLPDAIETLLADRGCAALPARDLPGNEGACGSIVLFRMPPVPISSTALRRQLQAGERPHELLSRGVLEIIDRAGLYR